MANREWMTQQEDQVKVEALRNLDKLVSAGQRTVHKAAEEILKLRHWEEYLAIVDSFPSVEQRPGLIEQLTEPLTEPSPE